MAEQPERKVVSKAELREALEGAMEDVAMLMADDMSRQQKLLEIRQRCAEVWRMADLGEVPELEVTGHVVGRRGRTG